jgi:anti-sigma B factor antagonist
LSFGNQVASGVPEDFLLVLTTNLKKVGTASVVSLTGRVTLGKTAEAVGEVIEQELSEGVQNIVLNLSGVTFIDSSGLGTLVANLAKTKAAGGMLKLAEPQERVKSALELTRLTGLFPLYATEQDALNSFNAAGAEALVQ